MGGVSFGGAMALRIAAEHPTLKTRNLVLMSTTIMGATSKERKRNNKMSTFFGSMPDYKLYWVMETMIRRGEKDLPANDTLDVRDVLRIKHPDYYRQVTRSLKGFDASVYARVLEQPVLMIMGAADDLYTELQAAEVRSHIPHVEYRVIEDATHSMVYTHGEQVAAIIRGFCMEHCDFTWME